MENNKFLIVIIFDNITVFTVFLSNKCSFGEHKKKIQQK